eukprot:26122-Alexandrium_andersonii.AAC.1
MSASLVGSEMCIRDSTFPDATQRARIVDAQRPRGSIEAAPRQRGVGRSPVVGAFVGAVDAERAPD